MFFRRLRPPILVSSALCLALFVGSAAFALAQTQGPAFAACTAKGENGAEFPAAAIMDTGGNTLTLNSLPYFPGFPLMLIIPVPREDGPFSAGTEEDEKFLLVNGERKGGSLSFQIAFHDHPPLSLSCQLPSSPSPAPACDIPPDALEGNIMKCARFLTASRPACGEWKDFLIPTDSFTAVSSLFDPALLSAQAFLPAFYTGGYRGAVHDLIAIGDPTITSVLADIELSCGRRLNIVPDAALPSAQWSVFSPQDFTVYLSDALSSPRLPPFHLYQTLLRALALARNSCETEEEFPEEFPRSDACLTEAAAAMSFCISLVPAFSNVPDPAIREFLCALSDVETADEGLPEPDGATGTSSMEPSERVCTEEECGPRPLMPAGICPDGVSTSGPTGRCFRNDDDRCGWEVLYCPS